MLTIGRIPLTAPCALLFCFFTLTLNLFVGPTGAVDPQKTSDPSIPTQARKPTLEATSTQDLNFQDIYQIALTLDIPADIEISATEGEVIRVTLERYTQATNTARDTHMQDYLKNISLTTAQTDGTLQIGVQLPEAKPNPLPSIPDQQATLQEQLQVKWTIKTPPDVSVKIQAKKGDIHLTRIRGKIEIATQKGNVQLDETAGTYNVTLKKGNIDGKILLTHGQNTLKTQDGSIGLTVLDSVTAPADVTAQGGSVRLELPENYAADLEIQSEKEQVVINLPAEIDHETSLTFINGGGPLLRLKATEAISILPSTPKDPQTPSDPESDPFAKAVQPVPETARPPIIDGNLSEIAWHKAAVLAPFQNPEGTGEPNNPTETLLMWDAENLYIGIKASIAEAQFPHISQTQHDSPIWEDECIEILMDPNISTDTYYHLVINPIGALFDQQVNLPGDPDFQFAPHDVQLATNWQTVETAFDADSTWNSGAEVATEINTTFWSIEVALPRKMLEKPAKSDSQDGSAFKNRWLFNIHRKAHANVASTKNLVPWLFNIHRKAHGNVGSTENLLPTTEREYSCWLPTYSPEYPWWTHAPHEYVGALSKRSAPAMGLLRLVTVPAIGSEDFTSEEKFQVKAIEIEGNTKIATESIQQSMPIQPGDLITVSALSWLIAELRNHDWFQDVRVETKQEKLDPGSPEFSAVVSVHIHVTEAPVVLARQVKITGNRSFPARFIKEWFRLKPGYIALATAKLKQQLIADFYANRGYEFATVTSELSNDVLEFTINEGTLHEIRFTGNARISHAELLAALDLKTENSPDKRGSQTPDIYHRTLGQSKVNRMRKELRENNEHFKSVREWRVQREGGKNVMIVEIEEQSFVTPGVFPILQFNRVHGLLLGAGGTLATRLTGKEQVFAAISRGFSSKTWDYHAGLEKGFFQRQPLKLGGSFYKLTDVSSNTYLHHGDASLGAAYYGFDLQDYYERQGSQGWVILAPSEWTYLRLEFTAEAHDNLSKSTDWSYLNRNQRKRGNARIDRGQLRSLALVFAFDTRDHRSIVARDFHTLFFANERTRRGWRAQFAAEMTGQYFGGDYDFNFYRFEIVRYTPLSGPHHLNVRVAGDFSDARLPRQRLLHLGGGLTLRGYDFNRFAGDNRLLLNVEYRLIRETLLRDPNAAIGWTLSCFLDTGSTWWHGNAPFSDFQTFTERLKASFGIGCSVFIDPFGSRPPWSLAIEVAHPLDTTFNLRGTKLISRFERIF